MTLHSPSSADLLREAIIFGSIACVIFAGRIWSRMISGGSWKRLQPDDGVMAIAFCFYISLLVLINIVGHYATNELDPALVPSVLADPKQVASRIYGSKLDVPLEQCMLCTLWGVKTCLLVLYWKMTVALQEHLFVKIVACYVALGFVVIEISFFFVYCRPFSQYWAFPVHNPQCANFRNYCITQMVFNVSSDALLLAIPLPLLLKSQLPPKKKALLVAVFSLGVFVMLAAILNKCYNFTMPNTTIYMVWHIREASTSIYVANLMCWWPLLRFLFGFRSFSGGPSSRSGAPGSKIGSSNLSRPKSGVFTRWRRRLHTRQLSGIGRNTTLERLGSQEAINTPRNQAPDIEAANAQNVPLEIWQKVEFDVDNYDIRPDGTPVNPRAYNYPLSGTKGYDPAVIVKRARDDFN